MNRKIAKKLITWKNSAQRKPMILRGARQVGKTFSLNSGKRNSGIVIILISKKMSGFRRYSKKT